MDTFNEANKIEIETYDLLKTVIDPELGVNIIDMGLVYEIQYKEEEGLKITMTLSTPGCPMGDVIFSNVEEVIKNKYPDMKVEVKLTWEPKWTPDFLTPDGKKALGMSY